MDKVLNLSEKLFDKIHFYWEGKFTTRFISVFLILVFISFSVLALLGSFSFLNEVDEKFKNPFFAIKIVFSILLIIELYSLIFVLPSSTSDAAIKQLEILSLVFIRGTFKEFSLIESYDWNAFPNSFNNMVLYALGAFFIFVVIQISRRFFKENLSTNGIENDENFIRWKKTIALFLLLVSITIGGNDLVNFIMYDQKDISFNLFFNALIFCDILIVLISLGYTMSYSTIFKYSAFVVATFFIRIALSTDIYYNILIGICSSLFVLGIMMVDYYSGKHKSIKG